MLINVFQHFIFTTRWRLEHTLQQAPLPPVFLKAATQAIKYVRSYLLFNLLARLLLVKLYQKFSPFTGVVNNVSIV